MATIKAIAAAARQDQATSLDRVPVWSAAVRGSDSHPNPTMMTQTIPVMKAFRADAFLVAICRNSASLVSLVNLRQWHSGGFAANDGTVDFGCAASHPFDALNAC